jgi:hypothetical protein
MFVLFHHFENACQYARTLCRAPNGYARQRGGLDGLLLLWLFSPLLGLGRFFSYLILYRVDRGSVLVEALCCTPQGRGSLPDEVEFFSNLPNPSGRTMALGSTEPLTKMDTRNLKKETWG